MSKISIIIPTHNRVNFLMETLRNLMDQTRVPDEIIVVDDRSTDQTRERVDSEFRGAVRLLTSLGHGPGAARNLGFKNATGDLIKFLDSDDLITRNLIEDQEKVLKDNPCDAVYNSYFKASVDENGNWKQEDVIMNYHPVPKSMSIHRLMIRGFFIPIPAFMFRRDLLQRTGPWNEEIVAYEDFDFLWRLTKESAFFCHSNKGAMLYRIHGKQTTEDNVSNLGKIKDRYRCWEAILEELNQETDFTWYEKQLIRFNFQNIRKHIALFENSGDTINYTLIQKMISTWERFLNKWGRLRTGTDWGRAFMPNASKEVFESYINRISN